jgi:hypothetical protein
MFLFAKGTDLRITVPSISIEDIKLPEELYKADFELSGRYQEFVKEMIRFSLLGIAGYGFLIEKVVGTAHLTMMATGTTFILVLIGIFCLVCSAGVGLYCGQLNRACILMQVSILRLLQRRQPHRWTHPGLSSAADVERWKAANEGDLKTLRDGQAANLRRAQTMQRATICLLLIGIVVTALVFIRCLYMNVQPS